MKRIHILICILFCVLLAACSKKTEENHSTTKAESTSTADAAEATNNDVAADEKLGTKWGDEIDSHVTEVDLKRKADTPLAEAIVQYADKKYQGKSVNSISLAAGKMSFSVVDDHGKNIPMYRVGQMYYLSGREGQSYQLKYENHTGRTFEVVASVDGVDVINGSEASRSNSGYVLNAHDSLTIEGFRKSDSAVASFTFSQPEDSYAANSEHGSFKMQV